MKKVFVFLLAAFTLFFSGCSGSNPKAKITSVEYVDSIQASGVSYQYEGKEIIQIKLDFTFDENIVSGLDQTSEDYRKNLYSILVKGAHLYVDGQEVDFTFGYWPDKAGSNYAKEMSLFYVVPGNPSPQILRFVYSGDVLGEGASGIDKTIKP